jgi:hypothetical protein
VGNYGTESHESGKWFPDGRAASESFTNFSRRKKMKKFTGFIAAAAIAIAPMSASALTALTDNAMNDVTGQAGVSIAIDDVVMETWVGETKYTDVGGAFTGDGDASLVIADKHTVKFYNAFGAVAAGVLHSPGANGLIKSTVHADAQAQMGSPAHALTIDVGTALTLSAAASINNGGDPTDPTDVLNQRIAGVIIGLPTLEIHTVSDSYEVGISSTGAENTGANFILVENGAKTQHILGGTLEIAPH